MFSPAIGSLSVDRSSVIYSQKRLIYGV